MISPAHILRSCLIDLELVSFPTTKSNLPPCFVTSFPTKPDDAICITDTAGRVFGRRARDGKMGIQPGVMIRIRTLTDSGFVLANAIAVALDQEMFPFHTVAPDDQQAYDIQNVIRSSAVIALGEEIGTRRQLWSINARIAFSDNQPSIG